MRTERRDAVRARVELLCLRPAGTPAIVPLAWHRNSWAKGRGDMGVTVNGETVEQSLIEQELSVLRRRYGEQLTPGELNERASEIASDARENAIERVILAQEARRKFPEIPQAEIDRQFADAVMQHGVTELPADVPEDEVKKMKAAVADSIRLEKYFALVCKDVPAPADEECRAHYEKHRDTFQSPEMIRASHIVRQPSREEDLGAFGVYMLNLREEALKGADFARLARQHSQCSDNGGSLGWFPRGTMVDSFEKVVFALEPGQVSDVFRTEFGYHIAKVHEKRPAAPIPFERVRQWIMETLLEERKNDEVGRVVDRLRESAKIAEE